MELQQALKLAQSIKIKLEPYCQRVEIAGSIRREKPEVKDIEIVAIPKYETIGEAPLDLFGNPAGPPPKESLLVKELLTWQKITWIKPGTSELVEWPVKPHAKYFRGLLANEIKLDLFTATPDNWGLIFAIRTGSADYSHKVLARKWVKLGYESDNGMLQKEGKPVPVLEEKDLFKLLYLEYVEPKFRNV